MVSIPDSGNAKAGRTMGIESGTVRIPNLLVPRGYRRIGCCVVLQSARVVGTHALRRDECARGSSSILWARVLGSFIGDIGGRFTGRLQPLLLLSQDQRRPPFAQN